VGGLRASEHENHRENARERENEREQEREGLQNFKECSKETMQVQVGEMMSGWKSVRARQKY